ncbi:LysR substrate-binding domain-containing protein [Quadrisphaera sp. KR29]|uniref:LysR substrate-binding domain-containing protein n=1 Tax=Quadrisphaera sp. KR29 TaxID=3461391 RepID=UPI004044140D
MVLGGGGAVDLRWLRAFVVVAQELHFRRAGALLGTTTSGVSAQVRALEEHLGARLLERGRRSTPRLTAAGEVFLPEARAVLEGVERAVAVGRAAGRGLLGRVRVGYVASAAFSGVLAETVAAPAAGSRVEVEVTEMSTPDQLEALLARRIDVGLLRHRPELPAGLHAQVVRTEPVVVALPERHPAAGSAAVTAGELAGERFAAPLFAEVHGAAEEVAAVVAAGGLPAPQLVAVRDYVAALALVGAGTAVALVPECVGRLPVPGVRCAALAGVQLTTSLLRVHRADEASAAVLSVLRGAAPGPGAAEPGAPGPGAPGPDAGEPG